MTYKPRASHITVVGLLIAAAPSVAQEPATLKSLEDRELVIEPASEARQIDPRAQRENYQRLLELTADQKPQTRIPVMLRLAAAELELATEETDPTVGAKRAIDLYQQVLAQDAVQIDRPLVLYNLARAQDLAGQTEVSAQTLARLVNGHPGSELVPEARFRRAETNFVLRNFAAAESDYAALVELGDTTPFFLRARHKRGWSLYKLSDHQASLDAFTSVVKSELPAENVTADATIESVDLSESGKVIIEDSLRGMTLNFSQLSKQVKPADYVDAAGLEPYEFLVFNNLLAHYLEQERFTEASATALAFARRNPQHPESKNFELQAIKALEDGGFPTLALAQKETFVKRYGVEREPWLGEDPVDVPKARERLLAYLDEITRTYHAAAQESKKPEDYQRAAQWYGTYLDIFPEGEKAPQYAFLRGEVLYEAGAYAEAAEQYAQVAYDMGSNSKAREAAYAALLAWREAAGAGAATDPRVESATLKLVEEFPAHEQANNALARLAEDRFQAQDLEGANQLAIRLIEHEPRAAKNQLANAWRIRAAHAKENNDYVAQEQALGWLLANNEAQDRSSVNEGLAAAIYRQGEVLAEKGDDEGAQRQFMRLQELPASSGTAADAIRATALFDAAAASLRNDNKAESIRLLERFRNQYPRHELAPKATTNLAALYLETDNKRAAADAFAEIRGQSGASAQTRSDAALQAAQLYEETDQTAAAAAAYEVYLSNHNPGFTDAMEARHKLVEFETELGRTGSADQWRRAIIRAEAAAGGASTERSRTLAAQATLRFADAERAQFDAARLTPPLQQSLRVKKSRLEAALAEYGKAADYGISDVTTAATYRIGQLYYDFSRALLESPRPSNLSGEELAQYEILLEEQAFPLEEQSISIHEANVDRIGKGVYDQWVRRSLTQLGKLLPARYAKKEQFSNAL